MVNSYTVGMKYCRTCKEDKHESLFGRRKASIDGLAAKCKTCQSEYDKKRTNLPHRVKARRIYIVTDAGKRARARANSTYCIKYPKKYKAHTMTGNAIRDKKLFKEPCEVCGATEKIHAHHDDYAKPLNVRWLCSAHHSQWHRDNGEASNA